MKHLLMTLTILAISAISFAQIGNIENINVEQRDDGTGIVDIHFDLSADAGNVYHIVIKASFDGGDTFSVIPAEFLSVNLEEVSPATNIQLEWDGMGSHPDIYTEEAQLKFVATLIDSDDDDPVLTVTDIDGNVYPTIIIGDQEWMTENLRVTHYNNGDPIATDLSDEDWENADGGAYAVFPHFIAPGIDSDEEMAEIYGLFYNWHTFYTEDGGLCPAGWRVPSQADWDALIGPLGGQHEAGAPLKGTRTAPDDDHPRWDAPNTGATNASEMSLYPSGRRNNDGSYQNFGTRVWYWVTESLDDSGRGRSYRTEHDDTRSRRYVTDPRNGLSIRCLRDVEE